ncbi:MULTISPECIES: MazG nucleotide pyrophosphohydrolase domain-containing protein [unclassified Oleiphilus]|uniref:MazG nucleotide pyrophosphohydrolase domain-containing protein n=1 Tax=unclassified Oleiphilus TaxID=2631174 RepID=UPI0007C297C1|nr:MULTISPECIES: MazG nucleotide pyrophosphohydrolase domain-containing protein [unclassified Oleiphilus]KZY42696.1 hypothetical protein A3732_15845 [Oleiphilus sp. HI0050]KZY78017.1 hypothetical protein A3740_08950 [Oleiphilus sp. HI0068]KZY81227.1 hypothetical protein A3741_17500 [Oleiphilus sp. HI0069]KZY94260.1 hypothetical protein A3743_05950 [Oleiphilus sp. HI0072]KZZ11628.1 hypothetical protein A3749_00975 [Oleiphilus sp. HI0078]KZZ30195.1 hypothetical protein A3752_17460 [Oleiphilus s
MSSEKVKKAQDSILEGASNKDGVLNQALDIQARAAKHGFDWPEIEPVFDKIAEELDELKQEVIKAKAQCKTSTAEDLFKRPEIRAEFGDLLFSCLNLSRFLGVLPQDALQLTNDKFTSRFQFIEEQLGNQGTSVSEVPLTQLDQLWELAKLKEK